MRARESGWVKSRTHEILKSFLGSPHQHMLLSSPPHFLLLLFLLRSPSAALTPTRGIGSSHVPPCRPFMCSPIHSAAPGRLTPSYLSLREIRFCLFWCETSFKVAFASVSSKLVPVCVERIQSVFNATAYKNRSGISKRVCSS